MYFEDSDFNGYIGIKININTSHARWKKDGLDEVPVLVRWCPVVRKNKHNTPDWDKLQVIADYEPTILLSNQAILDKDCDALWEEIHKATEYMIQDVMDHFCIIGECKINPHRCPERKDPNVLSH